MRIGALCGLMFAVVLAAWPVSAQSTAIVTVKSRTVGRDTVVQTCTVAVEDTAASGVVTNSVLVRFAHGTPDTVTRAPFDLRIAVGEQDTVRIAKGAQSGRINLVHSELRGGEIRVSKSNEAGALCALKVEEEDEPLEIDPAFQILAGIEFISMDGFKERTAHIPAMARWIIPVYVQPARPRPEPVEGTRYWDRRRDHWYNNPYAVLITSAEYTRMAVEERNFLCSGTIIPRTADPGGVSGTECSPNQAKGTDSVTVFRERAGGTDFATRGTWRIMSTFRREGNLGWADNDVYAGPMITIGLQTDPGIGSPDFFPFYAVGLSLTQVEITEEDFRERFNLQLAWGQSPNYSERVLLLPDSTEVRREIEVPNTNRMYLSTAFQPLDGYFLRGSAEFGEGVPDVARIGIMIQLNVENLIGSLFGEKEKPKPSS
jgi:hypothetical protein